jgi:hypothetical protein
MQICSNVKPLYVASWFATSDTPAERVAQIAVETTANSRRRRVRKGPPWAG